MSFNQLNEQELSFWLFVTGLNIGLISLIFVFVIRFSKKLSFSDKDISEEETSLFKTK